MELKAYSGELKELDKGDGVAVFATFNIIDKDGDVTLPGAFGTQDAAIVPAHNWGSVPLGKGITSEVGDEARVALKFNLESPTAAEWYSALKFDVENGQPIQEWSYGFDVIDSEIGEFDGKTVRFLKKMKVHEVSPVLIGAGENTRTLAIKSAKQTFADQLEQVIADVEAATKRASEVQAMRERKGKNIGVERVEQLGELIKSLQDIVAIAGTSRGVSDDEVYKELARVELRKLHHLTSSQG